MINKKSIDCDNCQSRDKGIFCGLELKTLEGISCKKITNTYKKGHNLFFQGNPPYGLYCVNSGKVKLSQVGNDGKEAIVRIAGPGDILGHRSLFSNQSYHATAVTIEESVICLIEKNHIYEVIQQNPSVALNIIERLSREMGAAEKRGASMSQKNVRERLAELFLMMMKTYGIRQKDGRIKLDIFLTREELASMTGTANETVIRFISEFKDEGLIMQEGKTIFIVNEEKLLEFANLNY